MRYLSIILCSVILSLASTPTLKLLISNYTSIQNCCENSCDEENTDMKSHTDENCTGSTCNPFAICCSCVLHLVTSSYFLHIKPQQIVSQPIIFQPKFTSFYNVEFWQPPKLS